MPTDKFSRREWLDIGIGLLLGFLIFFVLVWAWPPLEKHHDHNAQQSPDGRGSYHEIDKTFGEWFSAIWDRTAEDPVALYTLVLCVFTALLGFATVRLWIITGKLVAGANDTATRELRAYLSVVVGNGIYQDERLRFEARPLVLNNGKTPAYNVRHHSHAEILSDAAANDFVFKEPIEATANQSSIGPNENRILRAIVEKRVPDDQIASVKQGIGSALYVWGVVRYNDCFGNPRYTQYCQKLSWEGAVVFGTYDGRFSRSD